MDRKRPMRDVPGTGLGIEAYTSEAFWKVRSRAWRRILAYEPHRAHVLSGKRIEFVMI